MHRVLARLHPFVLVGLEAAVITVRVDGMAVLIRLGVGQWHGSSALDTS
jgi:hypothetical protein